MTGLIGAIEAGGTKTVCALGTSFEEVFDAEKLIVPSASPRETMTQMFDWIDARRDGAALDAVGVGTFGPVDLATGRIATSTPKIAWRGFSWSEAIRDRFGDVSVAIDTDVNAAGVAEWRWGASRGCEVSVYITVGTGIGGALVVAGRPLHGLQHPEFGHMFVPRAPGDDFSGVCLSHGDCLEGLASGMAIEERWGIEGKQLRSRIPRGNRERLSRVRRRQCRGDPRRRSRWCSEGGVMSVEGLIEKVRTKTRNRVSDYFTSRELHDGIDTFLVAPALGASSGVLGAFALGLDASGTSI